MIDRNIFEERIEIVYRLERLSLTLKLGLNEWAGHRGCGGTPGSRMQSLRCRIVRSLFVLLAIFLKKRKTNKQYLWLSLY
jgi:hypothetical protein